MMRIMNSPNPPCSAARCLIVLALGANPGDNSLLNTNDNGGGTMRDAMDILVAEDQPGDVFLLKRAFLRAGITAPLHFVRDGQEAIDYLRGTESFRDRTAYPFPCLMLLDLKMPRINGFEVLDWVRQQPALKRLPIIVLTSSNISEDVDLRPGRQFLRGKTLRL